MKLSILERFRPLLRKRALFYTIPVFIVFVAAIILLAYWLDKKPSQVDEANQTPVQFSVVKKGSIKISTSGSGKLVAAQQVELSFPVSGTVGLLNVSSGDVVNKGDILAALSSQEELEADMAAKKLAVLKAQQALDDYHKNANLTLAEAYSEVIALNGKYEEEQTALLRKSYARCSQEVNIQYSAQVDRLQEQYDRLSTCCYGSDEWIEIKNQYDTAFANRDYCAGYTDQEILQAEANLQISKTSYERSQAAYDQLVENAGVDKNQLSLLEATLENAKRQRDLARSNLEAATMVSPLEGTVVQVAAQAGEKVGTSTFITIANLDQLFVEVYLDETDATLVSAGKTVEVIFDALPDHLFYGDIVQVDPELYTSGNYSVIKALAQLDMSQAGLDQFMPLGLNASVEVISAQSLDTLLVPVDSIKQIDEGEYAVFVQDTSTGKLRLRVVEVGLMNVTHAEIISGLSAGERVSTGIISTAD